MSLSTMTVGATQETTTSKACAVPAPTVLPPSQDPRRIAPADARELTKVLLLRLDALEEGTHEYQYVRNTLIEMNLTLVRYAARRFSVRGDTTEDMLQVGTIGLIKAIDRPL
ncbi:sigma factor [Streptomyces nigrescens]